MDMSKIESHLRVVIGDNANVKRLEHTRVPMFSFTLPGDRVSNMGRAIVKNGAVTIWHMGFKKDHWLKNPPWQAGYIGKDEAPIPSHSVTVKEFLALEPGAIARPRPQAKAYTPPSIDWTEMQVANAALADLDARGWKLQYERGGIFYLNDGTGSTPAGRLMIHSGNSERYASFRSYRGDPMLSDPWRSGKEYHGVATYIASAQSLAGTGHERSAMQINVSSLQRQSAEERRERFQKLWNELSNGLLPVPATHHHLQKGVTDGIPLDPPSYFGVVANGKYAGAILIPMMSFDSGSAEIVGGQVLLPGRGDIGTDKIMLPGSRATGSFLPLPPPAPGETLESWVQARAQTPEDKALPIVLCEGLATGLAIAQARAGHPVVCFSASNLMAVAKKFREAGLDEIHGLVIAADNDISVDHAERRFKSDAVYKAILAARETEAQVAFIGISRSPGYDARDLLVTEGPQAVRRYIERARSPDEVEAAMAHILERRLHTPRAVPEPSL